MNNENTQLAAVNRDAVNVAIGQSKALGIMDVFMPRTRPELLETCSLVSNSSICPKGMKGDVMAVLACIEIGERFNLTLLAAIQNITFISGRMCMWGDVMLGIVRASPLCISIHEEFTGNIKDGSAQAVCTITRKGEEHPIVRSFSFEDAKRAGLWGKQGPWVNYPARMLQMRARGFALRDAFPDVLAGIITREEAEDYVVDARSGSKVERPKGPVVEAQPEVVPAQIPALPAKELTVEKAQEFFEQFAAAASRDALLKVQAELREYKKSEVKESLYGPFRDALAKLPPIPMPLDSQESSGSEYDSDAAYAHELAAQTHQELAE